MRNELEIQELISRMVSGDNRAWKEFMKDFHRLLDGYLQKKAPNLDTDNILSNFYLKLMENDYQRLKKFTFGDQRNLWNYLRSILQNEILTESRNKSYNSNEFVEEYHSNNSKNDEDREEYIYQDITHEMFMEAVMLLNNVDHRKSIYLLYLGNTNREIAEILNKPINTILSWNKRAKENLILILENMRTGAIK